MKKLTVLLAGLLCIMNLVVAVGETQITHSASCSVAHEDFVMIDESSADFDTDLTRQICGGYWGSSKTKIALFPSHAKDGMKLIELTTIKPLEGGFAGIFYLSEDSQLELIIIPDTYRSSSYLAPLAGKLQYVALPSNDRFTVSERNDMMFNDHIGLTFLVVEGSAAHEYCVEKNLPHVFRKEYCHYVNENGVFDSEMFYQDIPNMINSSEEAAQSGSPVNAKMDLSHFG